MYVLCTMYINVHLYIYFTCLSWRLVCLFVSNKRPNGWTDRAQILCRTSHDYREGLWIIKSLKISLQRNLLFIKFWKSTNCFLWNPRTFFYSVAIQRESVHNWNRRWARSALKASNLKLVHKIRTPEGFLLRAFWSSCIIHPVWTHNLIKLYRVSQEKGNCMVFGVFLCMLKPKL